MTFCMRKPYCTKFYNVFRKSWRRGVEERRVKNGLDGKMIMRWGRKILVECKEMKVEWHDAERTTRETLASFYKLLHMLSPLPGKLSSTDEVIFQDPAQITLALLSFLWLRLWFCPYCARYTLILLHRTHCVTLINFWSV